MNLFKFYNHSIVEIEVFDPSYTLDKLKNSKIIIYNLKKVDKYHYSFITHNKYVDLLVKNFNSIKIKQKIGILNYLKNNLLRFSTIISILLSLLLYNFMNSLIMDVNISGDASSLEYTLEEKLIEKDIQKYKKLKNNNELLKIEKEIAIELYDLIEWIEIKNQGLNVSVRYLKRRDKFKNKNSKKAIYSTKEGIIKGFSIEKGIKMVKENDYVRVGELLIDGYIRNEEKEKYIGAIGSVYAYTWFNIALEMECKNNDKFYIYETLINEANMKVDKELTGDDEYIESEKIIKFEIKNGVGKLVIHYTLVEDITR